MVIGKGQTSIYLTEEQVALLVKEGLSTLNVDGKRVLILIPDGTRTMPMGMMFRLFREYLSSSVSALDYLVALGTHQSMNDAQLSQLVGQKVAHGKAGKSRIFNHSWDDPGSLVQIGSIPASEISQLTGGLISDDVPVHINHLIMDYDQLIICGPVFPHEVVGFSGGNKYFFPGVSGPEIINFTHWLGALLTSYQVIGAGYTPVRAVIDRAAAFIEKPTACFALVVSHDGIAGLYFGYPQDAWKAAADLSAKVHIRYVEKPYKKVISVMPDMYDDLWTAAKGMYKLEPVVADGGEIIIFAPHIDEVSYTHGRLIDEIGYHCKDYFLKQWDRVKHLPAGILAHSTHVKGMGTYNESSGIETPRIMVTLATGISAERCQRINLNYRDPAHIDLQAFRDREDEGILVVPRAGEILYRLKSHQV